MSVDAEPAPDLSIARAAAPRRSPTGGFSITALWALYGLTLRQHLHGRRWIVVAGLFLLPAGLAVLIRATAGTSPAVGVEFLLAFMFIPQALLPLVALVYASGIIQDEQEDQTLTYLLIRPIPRWALFLVKLSATLTTTVLLTAVFTALTYAVLYIGGDKEVGEVAGRCLRAVAIHCVAVGTYCCLFGLIGLYTKRALVAGILYTAIIEGLLANLPFGLRFVTVIYYARIMAYRSLDFTFTEHGRREDIAASAWQIDRTGDPDLLGHPQFGTCLIVLLLASLACAGLSALLCTRREFHVKTPEGS